MNSKIKSDSVDFLFRSILKLKTVEECYDFFEDLCTCLLYTSLAAYYAKKMGLPIHKLICASNSNNVLTEFLKTGVYNRNREFHATISPSMDILISSNLERLLFDVTGHNTEKVCLLYTSRCV